MERFDVAVFGGVLAARVSGPTEGPRLLMLHGGPGLPDTYLDPLIEEFDDRYRVAIYAQRAVAPSTAHGPFDLATQAGDAIAVLDALDWDRALVLGHSFGGHLLAHVLAAHGDRLSAAILLDPLGVVGDGGLAGMVEAMMSRLAEDRRPRYDELDALSETRALSDAEATESLELVWPGYFATAEAAPPMPAMAISTEANEEGWAAIMEALPELAARVKDSPVPTLVLHCSGGPIPRSAVAETAEAIGARATMRDLDGVGHFPWLEQPRLIRSVVDEFLAG